MLNLLIDQEIDLVLSKMFGDNSFHRRKEDYGILFKDDREVQGLLGCLTFGCQSMNIFILYEDMAIGHGLHIERKFSLRIEEDLPLC
jgi:hypothetical protein